MLATVDVGGLISLAAVVGIFLLARARGKSLRASAHAAAYSAGYGAGVASATAAATAVNSTHVHLGNRFGSTTDDDTPHHIERAYRLDDRRTVLDRNDVGESLGMGDVSDGNERGQLPVGIGDPVVVRRRAAGWHSDYDHDEGEVMEDDLPVRNARRRYPEFPDR